MKPTESEPPIVYMIEEPAYVHLMMHDGASVHGRVRRYTDPSNASPSTAFMMEDSEGAVTFAFWGAIRWLKVTPLVTEGERA